jgi:hypothetical protein
MFPLASLHRPNTDPNIAILPQWNSTGKGNMTVPFLDTHVAVRFLGGVSNRSAATAPDCTDRAKGLHSPGGVDVDGLWCDLVVRQNDGSLKTRFDLIHSRLDRFVDNGIDLMIVLDNVPWAFVDATSEPCQGFGCQYLPPQNATEFAEWMGSVATYFVQAYGEAYSSKIRWRLGTETNGPRWGGHGLYFNQVLECYVLTMRASLFFVAVCACVLFLCARARARAVCVTCMRVYMSMRVRCRTDFDAY